ncbi:MAG TPA: hypothetical protein PKK06_00215 [Phycisphaerae bacterium]|nr:hypothetical protein [Phycisphaerae bacterium]HNU43965.1 hypothetical protein [Phycisphaerae bacterium]
MEDTHPSGLTASGPAPPLDGAALAFIELDRFCPGCGYNLRTQAVRREPHTGLHIVRCPECGQLHPANEVATEWRPWLHRVTALLLGFWVLGIIGVLFLMALGQGALMYVPLTELTLPDNAVVQQVGSTTITTVVGSRGALRTKPLFGWLWLFLVFASLLSFAAAFATGMLLVVLVPHWRRIAYVSFVALLALTAGIVVGINWYSEAPQLSGWGLKHVAAQTTFQVLGGWAGVMLGRSLARLVVRIMLPPRLRPRLAYLWLADGNPLPPSA